MLTAARRSAAVASSALDDSLPEEDPLRRFLAAAADATTETVDDLLRTLAGVPLALPVHDRSAVRRSSGDARTTSTDDDDAPEEQPLIVCVLSLNGSPASTRRSSMAISSTT
jgi:hypothetical protein